MKKVLIAPLDWGLGHATRCIPIIEELLKRNCDVCVAGSGDSLVLLKNEFPFLTFFTLPPYDPVYPSSGSMVWKMLRQLPKFVSVIKKEHSTIEHLILENKINLVISDNRYGCWSARIPTVFITHQRNILMPKGFGWLAGLVRLVSEKMIKRFSFCWIPDLPDGHSLAGKLMSFRKKGESKRVKYIGHLSRFRATRAQVVKYDVACIFSGPEPQRSILEKIVVEQVQRSGLKYFVVRGLLSSANSMSPKANHVDFLNSEGLQSVIEQSTYIIARSGYSTVMDLSKLGKKVIFIPTPGQTEQEYLAERLMKMKIAFAMPQHKFDLETAWEESKSYTGFHSIPKHARLLEEALDQILLSLSPSHEEKKIFDSMPNGFYHEKFS